jgi:hypothetical protein
MVLGMTTYQVVDCLSAIPQTTEVSAQSAEQAARKVLGLSLERGSNRGGIILVAKVYSGKAGTNTMVRLYAAQANEVRKAERPDA